MNFKEMVERDNVNVFLNCGEFAEKHTIKFDGKTYENISVILSGVRQSERIKTKSDNMQGVYSVTAKAYFSINDTEGNMPEHGKRFEIDDGEALGKTFFRRYRVASVQNEMGMICLELVAYDE